jgi:streptogramin lyase
MKIARFFFLVVFGAGSVVASAQNKQTFVGVITDTMCGKDHSMMKDPPDGKCVLDCVKAGAKYAIHDGKAVYALSDQETPAKYAAQKVKVVGILDPKTNVIKVESIQAAK